MLPQLLTTGVFVVLLIFARLGAAASFLPGIGEVAVSPRVRLAFALLLSIILTPLVAPVLPPPPSSVIALVVFLGTEVFIGVVIGMIIRMMISGLQIAGTIIAYHTGMGAAMLFDPTQGQQGAITGAFLTTMGVTLLFVTNLHHLMLMALADSYTVFPAGGVLPVGDIADSAALLLAKAFRLGLQIAMPVVVIGILIYLSMGLMARLMPQMQVFFIALPLQIAVGLLILSVTLPAAMLVFLEDFEASVVSLFRAG